MQRQRTVPNGNAKISRRRPRSVEGTQLNGHSMFGRGRQRNVQKVTTHVHENHEKLQHFRSQRTKSSLTSRCFLKGKISGGIKGFSSLIKFVEVPFSLLVLQKIVYLIRQNRI